MRKVKFPALLIMVILTATCVLFSQPTRSRASRASQQTKVAKAKTNSAALAQPPAKDN